MKRPKTPRPERLDHKGRKIIPSALRDDLFTARKQAEDAMLALAVAHDNYGLGDFRVEYEGLRAICYRLDEVIRTTTTKRNIEAEARYGL